MTAGTRSGFSLVEALASLVLAALVAGSVAGLLQAQGRAARAVVEEAEDLEASRVVRVVLQAELRQGLAGRDWLPPAGDTLALRAFRGVAAVCLEAAEAEELVVRYRGIRSASPGKDSALALFRDGRWEAVDLVRAAAAAGACPRAPSAGGTAEADSGVEERWALDRPARGVVLLRLFERGSYHLADGAFRYRSGHAGRQPLTPERFHDGGSRLSPREPGVEVELRLRPRAGSAGGGQRARQAWRVWSLEGVP